MCQDIGPNPNNNYEEHKNYGKENREQRDQETQTTTDTDFKQDDTPVNTNVENDTKQENQGKTNDTSETNNSKEKDDNADTKDGDKSTDSSKSTTEEKHEKASNEREKERPVIIEKTVSILSSLVGSISSGVKGIPEKFESFKEGVKESFKEKTEKAYNDFHNSHKGQEVKEFLKELNSGYKDLMNKPADNSTSITNKDKNEPKKDTKPVIPQRTMKPEQIAATRFVMNMKDPTFNFTPIQVETKTPNDDKSSTTSTETTGDKSGENGEKSSGIIIPTNVGGTESGEKPAYDPQQNVTAILTANSKEEQKRSDEKYTSLNSNFFQDGKEHTPTTARIEVIEKIDSLGKADKNNNSITAYTMVKYVSGKPEIYKSALERIVQLNPNMDISSLRGVTMGEVKYGTIYGSEQKPILAKDLDSKPESTYKLTAMIATCAVAVLTCSKDMQEFKDIQAEKAAIGLPANSQIMTPKEIEIYRNFGIISEEKATELRQEYDARTSEITGKISELEDKVISGYNEGHADSTEMFNIISSGQIFDKDPEFDKVIQLPEDAYTSVAELKEQFENGEITPSEYLSQLEKISTYDSIAQTSLSIKVDMENYDKVIGAGLEAGVLQEQDGRYITTTELIAEKDNSTIIACPAGTEFPKEINGAERLDILRDIFTNFNSGNISGADVSEQISNIPESSYDQTQYSMDDLIDFIIPYRKN